MKILKIKADKMQELAKFGFVKTDGRLNWKKGYVYEKKNSDELFEITEIFIYEDGKIFIPHDFWGLSLLYDLIKSDMVEVVEE